MLEVETGLNYPNMGSLTIKVSAKADAMIATLQKEIFNRRRKKITPQGVVESLVESGAKSQSDKRYASSWKNLIKDIEKDLTIENDIKLITKKKRHT